MKNNIRKLAVFVIIAAIGMFTVVAIASAGCNKHIQGEYAVTGANTCIIAPLGFDTNLVPIEPPGGSGVWAIETGYWLGVFTFNSNGTGSLKALQHTSLQPGPGLGTSPSAGSANTVYDFTYTVAPDCAITFTEVPCSYQVCSITPTACGSTPTYILNIPQNGVISSDGENLIVNCGTPVLLHAYGACSGGIYTSFEYDVACNVSLSGFKVPATFTLPE